MRRTTIKRPLRLPIPTILLLLGLFALLGLTLALVSNGDDDGDHCFTPPADDWADLDPTEPLMPYVRLGYCPVCGYHPPPRASVMSLSLGYADALPPPSLSHGAPLSPSRSSAPVLHGQSEYMIGDVALAVIFPESDGAIDPESENWTPDRVNTCIAEITAGLSWWASQEPAANLTFQVSYSTQPTGYEPITQSQNHEDLWIAEIMTGLGYSSGTYLDQVAAFNDYEMSQQGADWAFTIFVADSFSDADGSFSDGSFAYSYVGGPFTVMTYDNQLYGIGNMDWVCAHETGHIFWATDEYDGFTEPSGYLNVPDHEGADCIMNDSYNLNLCTATRGQIGWRDSDSDNILDPMDTTPDTVFDPAPSDFTSSTVLIYTGHAEDMPLVNNNPQWYSSGQDISINTITDVQYRVDGGDWQGATASDGNFDEGIEAFSFTTSPPIPGTYMIEVRAQNSAGNWETSYAQHAVVIDVTDPSVAMSGIPDFVRTVPWFAGAATDTAPGQLDRVDVQIRNVSLNTYWDGSSWTPTIAWLPASGTNSWSYTLPSLANGSNYELSAIAIDKAENVSARVSDNFTFDTTIPTVTLNDIPDAVDSLPAVTGTASDAVPGQLERVVIRIRNVSQNTYWDEANWVPTPTWLNAAGKDAWSRALPPLTNGSTYEVMAMSIDKAGNTSLEISDTFTFSDVTTPTVSIIDLPDFVKTLPAVTGTAADVPPGQLDRVEIQIKNVSQNTCWDGSVWVSDPTWVVALGTDPWSYTMPPLHNGSVYEINALAIDTAENSSTVDSDTFTLDTATPAITMNDMADPLNSLPSIGGTAGDVPPGQLDRVDIQIRNVSQSTCWDGSSWVATSAWVSASGTDSWICALPSLDCAVYEVSAKAIDRAGNESAIASDTFTFDATAPTITISDVPDLVNSLSLIAGAVSDALPGQVNRVEIQIKNASQNNWWDGSSWLNTSTWVNASGIDSWSYAMPPLDDGSIYEVRAIAIDTAQNASVVASENFTFDTTLPAVTINDIPDLVNSLSSLGGAVVDAPPGQVDKVEIQIKNASQNNWWDGSSWVTDSAWITTSDVNMWSYPLPPLDNASVYEVRSKATDRAGNESAVAWDTFVVDTTVPAVAINDVPDSVDTLSAVGGTGDDAPPGQLDRVEIQIRNVGQDTCWDGSSWVTALAWVTASGTDTWSCALPSLDDGSTYEIRARAIDRAGNESEAAVESFTVDSRLPAWVWIIIGVGAVLLAALIVVVLIPRLASARRSRTS